uniref:Uncharacterized protein n=1 Tax=Arion vulgaris TaxID=1028688 RepID=A0A0B7B3N3_9EUPU
MPNIFPSLHVKRTKYLEHLVRTGRINEGWDRAQQEENILDSLTLWHRKMPPFKMILLTVDVCGAP